MARDREAYEAVDRFEKFQERPEESGRAGRGVETYSESGAARRSRRVGS